jgi:hypothetical protein
MEAMRRVKMRKGSSCTSFFSQRVWLDNFPYLRLRLYIPAALNPTISKLNRCASAILYLSSPLSMFHVGDTTFYQIGGSHPSAGTSLVGK